MIFLKFKIILIKLYRLKGLVWGIEANHRSRLDSSNVDERRQQFRPLLEFKPKADKERGPKK